MGRSGRVGRMVLASLACVTLVLGGGAGCASVGPPGGEGGAWTPEQLRAMRQNRAVALVPSIAVDAIVARSKDPEVARAGREMLDADLKELHALLAALGHGPAAGDVLKIAGSYAATGAWSEADWLRIGAAVRNLMAPPPPPPSPTPSPGG